MPVMNAERIEARIALTKEKRTGKGHQTPEARRARRMHKRAQRRLSKLKATQQHQANRVKKKEE